MVLVLYILLCDFARLVEASINISGSSRSWKWGGRDIKFLDESVVDEVFCGSTVH